MTRTIPPAAAPVSLRDLLRGIAGMAGSGSSGRIQREIREYFGSEYVFLVSSGKAALALILMGLSSIRPRKKVLIPAYTCYSVPSAISKTGLDIVLCDVDPNTLDFDHARLETLADEETLCLVATHLFGIPSDVERLRDICSRKGIFLVEDAAQAMGADLGGRKLGTLADVGFFSLGRGKNITCGSGGIILTSDAEIARSMENFYQSFRREPAGQSLRCIAETALMKLFLNPSLYWIPKGLPFLRIGETKYDPDFPLFRLSESKAGMLVSWRERMEKSNRCRERIGRYYGRELNLPENREFHFRNVPFLRFPVYAETPDKKRQACSLFDRLGVSPMYPDSVNRIAQIRERFENQTFPGAEWIASVLITLPTHVKLERKDLDTLSRVLGNFVEHGGGKAEAFPLRTKRFAGTRHGRSDA